MTMKLTFTILTAIVLSIQCLVAQPLQPVGWAVQSTPTGQKLNDIFFVDQLEGWACGNDGTILHTTNGGVLWALQSSGTTVNLNSIFFTDNENGWIGGNASSIVPVNVLRTTDGGTNWEAVTIASFAVNVNGIHFSDPMTGWAVGESGRVFYTADGGTSWVLQSGGPGTGTGNNLLYDVHFSDGLNGCISGWQGTMFCTADGGANWTLRQTPYSGPFRAVHMFSDQVGWAVGGNSNGNGTIWQTSDAGANWDWQTFGVANQTQNYLRDVYFTDENNGWAVGGLGFAYVFRTANGGEEWGSEGSFQLIGNFIFNAVHFTDTDHGWVAGDGGVVLRYLNEGAVSSIANITEQSATHIYPNPFSNSTTISFELNTNQHVYLRVCDLQGREVIVLTDEQLAPGEHQFVFNGSNLNSGVYVYQLRLNGAIETGKLVLNK